MTFQERLVGAREARDDRKSLLAKAPLFQDGVEIASLRIRNLSAFGVGGVTSIPLEKGMVLTVRLQGIGDIPARVAWARGDKAGFQLRQRIEAEALKLSDLASVKLPGSGKVPARFEPVKDHKRPGFKHS
ncbi:hypothetical protein [Parasphingopyxis marina]|uniref:PilZ domain-containing protein n=1 Tax=Parasphingopyxis marina TaxID=2761622 RepID=A0A842HYF2_9SPHN|nr:hypothetical protein [Parasphingopyxis marina]MBC2777487.1 hypothetical protein [Parasphingopyxis marina]